MPQFVSCQQLPRYMTQAEILALFEVLVGPRDRALFGLIYLYGLRVSEVSLLRRGDVDLDRERIVVRRVKGGVWTERPLFRSATRLIARYLEDSPTGEPAVPLFPGQVGSLRKRRIQGLFANYRDRAGLDRRYTCHSLRHSIATHLLDAGLPLEFVQDHLGHQNIRSTTIYARVSDARRAAVFTQLESSPWLVHPTTS